MTITLKAARVNAGLTQTEAAKELGITPDTLGKYENGKSFPSVQTIEKMQELYGVSYDNIDWRRKKFTQ